MAKRKSGRETGVKDSSVAVKPSEPSERRRSGDAGNGCAPGARTGSSEDAGTGDAEDVEMRRFKAWMAKYEPVERAIHAARRKRAESSFQTVRLLK